jgi:hypothetical protein
MLKNLILSLKILKKYIGYIIDANFHDRGW